MISYNHDMTNASTKIAPIPNRSKIDQVVESIKKLIIEGELEPGTMLPSERELSTHLGVSRFSLREAFQVAKSHGLIMISRGKRPQVAGPSHDAAADILSTTIERSQTSLSDLIEVRKCLECEIARFAALRADRSTIEKLEDNLNQLKKHQGNLSISAEIDLQFHDLLVKGTGNVVFEIILAPLSQLLLESRKKTMKDNGVAHALDGHGKILNAIMNHDGDGAAMAMSEHLSMAKTDIDAIERT